MRPESKTGRSSHFAATPIIARKPSVSVPGDASEQEADAVADKVMRMEAPGAGSSPFIARKCAACDEDKEGLVQTKRTPGESTPTGGAENAATFATQGDGAPLSSDVRSYFEPRFGHDFSDVRVHSNSQAAVAASNVQARAYTYGRDIVFGAGEYAPETTHGKRLLAHELTHVVQQGGGQHTQSGDAPQVAAQPSGGVVARAGLGEMWDAFWGVGPVDAWRASTIADEALAAAQNTGMPGIHNGPADAWRHCFWNCNMTRALGYDQAETIASNHEDHGGGPAGENQMDAFNNEVGRNCGGSDCDNCCQTALDSGQLRVLDGAGAVVPSTATPRGTGTESGTSYDDSGYSTLPPAQRPPPPPPQPEPREWFCFTGAMPVTLSDGTSKPIEQIVVGDRVLAYDESKRTVRVCKVVACHRHAPASYLEIRLRDGRVLEVTKNHELYAEDGWRQAGDLRCGEAVRFIDRAEEESDLATVDIESVEAAIAVAPLFDITVAECHNYFVNGVLAHNKNI